MTRTAIGLALSLSIAAGPAWAAQPDKPRPAAARSGDKPGKVSELDKLKGDYKWGMSPTEVTEKIQDRVRATFDERLSKTANDPSRHDRLRKEMMAEVEKVKQQVIKFDGAKSGYDVSIIDQEFLHKAGESMLVAKEETATRYFFFKDDRLYKMFLGFDKEMLAGKSFREFGQLMQARFGKAKEITVQEKTKAGVKSKLDHFLWTKGGDGLRLVDRSEFYDVYCLVIYDGGVAKQQEAARQAQRSGPARDNLVEAVTAQAPNDLDPNDNVVDQITGKKVAKPGEQRGETITVPSVRPAGSTQPPAVTAPSPAEVNRPEKASEKATEKAKGGKSETQGLKL